jgi:hypothetical protein
VPAAAFVGSYPGTLTRSARTGVERAIDFHRRALARTTSWAGAGTPAGYRDAHHPYVDDSPLRRGRFRAPPHALHAAGEDWLAAWLATPAARTIRERQAAPSSAARWTSRGSLAPRHDARSELDRDRIVTWATRPIQLASRAVRGLARAGSAPPPRHSSPDGRRRSRAARVTLVLALLFHALAGRGSRAIATPSEPARALGWRSALRAARHGAPAAPRLATLVRRSPRARRRPFRRSAAGRPVDLPTRSGTRSSRRSRSRPLADPDRVRDRGVAPAPRRRGRGVVDLLGSSKRCRRTYTIEHPGDARPVIVDGGPRFEADALGHPLLPAARCVRNDVVLDATAPVLVVSGSNMSGKSTLLRAVGVNAVLALAGAPVRAARLRLSPLAIGASIRTLDSLSEGTSRFYAEITRIRHLVDLADGPQTLLFLLDEILHGTNSHDRRIGAEAIVRGLLRRGAIGLVTTHDLALTTIADDPTVRARNVHFADHVEDARMVFDYQMRDGVVTHSNALALMRAVGLEV